jgi:transposase-like protein
MTCYQEITCPDCGSSDIMKSGRSGVGTQRYRCRNPDCTTKTFMLDYRYKACEPGVKEQVVDMAINGSGIRDTARVLKINKNTVISTLKKSRAASSKSIPTSLS